MRRYRIGSGLRTPPYRLQQVILSLSVADPVFGAFLTPGSGIRDGGKNPDPDFG
jgi:hypothetical protein